MHHLTKFFFLLFILVVCSSIQPCKASHLVGSDISWACTGTPGIYKFTITLYRDCAGIPFCGTTCGAACQLSGTGASLEIRGDDPSYSGTLFGTVGNLNLIKVEDVGANLLCPNAKNTCTNRGCVTPGTFTPAIEKYVFVGDINLNTNGPITIPANCCRLRISYSQCCRNGAINSGAAGQNFYTDVVINRCAIANTPCNSSPIFTNEPYIYSCSGIGFIYNQGAIDIDMDSLSYSFVPSLQGPGASTTYIAPYTANTPMPWTGAANGTFPAGISCDAVNGDIKFTPNVSSTFIGVMAVEVKEWRKINGVPTVIGITRRDIQQSILACSPNNPPSVITYPGQSVNNPIYQSWETCAGEQLCFNIVAKDTNQTDTTYLTWNSTNFSNSISGATLTPNYNVANRPINGPRQDSIRFCWTPSPSQVSSVPYTFTVEAKDSRCPTPGRMIQSFSILVYPKLIANISKTKIGCNNWSATFTSSASSFQSRKFTISSKPNDSLFSQSPYVFNNVSSTPSFLLDKPGKYFVKLELTSMSINNTALCSVTAFDTITVDSNILTVDAIKDTSICSGGTAIFTATTKGGNAKKLFKWYNTMQDTTSAINSAPYTSPNFQRWPTDTRKYFLRVTDSLYCIAWDSVTVTVNPNAVLTRPAASLVCLSADSLSAPVFQSNISGGNGIWSYPAAPNAIVNNNTFLVKKFKNIPSSSLPTWADNWARYAYTTLQGCVTNDSAMIRIYSNPPVNAGPTLKWCELNGVYEINTTNQKYTLSNSSHGGIELWSGNGITGTLVGQKYIYSFNPSAGNVVYLPQVNIQQYTYTHIYSSTPTGNPIQCANSDTVKFEVTKTAVSNAGNDFSICKGENAINLTSKSATQIIGADSGKWVAQDSTIKSLLVGNLYFNTSSSLIPNPTVGQPRVYKFYYQLNNTCSTKDSILVSVKSKPTIGTISGNTLIKNNTNPFLYSVVQQPNMRYLWSASQGNVSGRNDTSFVSILWQVNNGTGQVRINITNNDNCSDTAALGVTITTGNQELPTLSNMAVYPNPNHGAFQAQLTSKESGDAQVQITDMIGRVVWTEKYVLSNGNNAIDFDLNIPAGVYLFSISVKDNKLMRKLVVE